MLYVGTNDESNLDYRSAVETRHGGFVMRLARGFLFLLEEGMFDHVGGGTDNSAELETFGGYGVCTTY